MITILDAPANVAAFRVSAELTKEDYYTVVVPAVKKLVKQINEINFLLIIDQAIQNLDAAALIEDAVLGLKILGKCTRTAIVTDCENAVSFTNRYSFVAPGECRGFKKERLDEAMAWAKGDDSNATGQHC